MHCEEVTGVCDELLDWQVRGDSREQTVDHRHVGLARHDVVGTVENQLREETQLMLNSESNCES